MVSRALIVTPTQAFGALIQQALEADDGYRPLVVGSGAEALERARQIHFDLAILDSDLSDLPLSELTRVLQEDLPEVRLLIIASHEDSGGPELIDAISHAILLKPFYLPDLVKVAGRLLGETHLEKKAVPSEKTAETDSTSANQTPVHPWLMDVARAAQHLTSLSLSSAAQAALIVRQGQLWAYAGQLSQPAAQELAQVVRRYWRRQSSHPGPSPRTHSREPDSAASDLATFVRLNTEGGEYMLYATSLGDEMVLALAFDTKTPFSKIRSQAGDLARALASPPGEGLVNPPPGVVASPASESPPAGSLSVGQEVAPLFPLEDVPPPTPSGGRPLAARALQVSWETPAVELYEGPAEIAPPAHEEPQIGEDVWVPEKTLEPRPGSPQETNASQESTSPPRFVEIDHSVDEAGPPLGAEPFSPAVYNLSYACLLIPRLPKHHLAGDLPARLAGWVRELCLAFDWRLEYLAIRPDYFQWVVSVSPSVSPSNLMRMMRQRTSERLFSQFPQLAQENPSGDFWAPGYLIMSSPKPPPVQVVKDFIRQTRKRQGANLRDH